MELQLYQGGVPADAYRKTTRDPEIIRQAAQALFSLRVERDAVNEDVPAGASAPILSFSGRISPKKWCIWAAAGNCSPRERVFTSCGRSFP